MNLAGNFDKTTIAAGLCAKNVFSDYFQIFRSLNTQPHLTASDFQYDDVDIPADINGLVLLT